MFLTTELQSTAQPPSIHLFQTLEVVSSKSHQYFYFALETQEEGSCDQFLRMPCCQRTQLQR